MTLGVRTTAAPGSHHHPLLSISFQELVEQRQFDKIKVILLKESDHALRYWLYGQTPPDPTVIDEYSEVTDDSTVDETVAFALTLETPIHRLMAVLPPVDIVQCVLQRVSSLFHNVPLDMTDLVGRTPLHIVTAFGSRSALVRLLTKDSTAAVMQDAWHRCPLHWACTHGKVPPTVSCCSTSLWMLVRCQSKADTSLVDNDEMVLIVDTLLRAYPEATLIRDIHGQTPVDLATHYGVDGRITALLDWTTERLRQERQGTKGLNHSDETSSTGIESFPQGFPGEINVISIPDDDSDEESVWPRRSFSWTTKSTSKPRKTMSHRYNRCEM